MSKRPRIKTPCVADRYAGSNARIAEVTGQQGKGCLISVTENDSGELVISVYRADPGVYLAVDGGVIELAPAVADSAALLSQQEQQERAAEDAHRDSHQD